MSQWGKENGGKEGMVAAFWAKYEQRIRTNTGKREKAGEGRPAVPHRRVTNWKKKDGHDSNTRGRKIVVNI